VEGPLGARFFGSTRGRIVTLLRPASRTVDELAATLGLTDNAVRSHLAVLERDGVVRQEGVSRGAGKPAALYALAAAGEQLFPKPYAPVLGLLLDSLTHQLPSGQVEDICRDAGRRLVASVRRGAPAYGSLADRIAEARAALNSLGGLVEVERQGGDTVLSGSCCPLSLVATAHPELCLLAESFVAGMVGVPVKEQCDRSDPPRCTFRISPAGAVPS
jgi:predicted ArsR family transcriptional regulator